MYDLSPFAKVLIAGRDVGPSAGHGGSFNISICGNLTEPCKDALTGTYL
jgi:hypothetical protein